MITHDEERKAVSEFNDAPMEDLNPWLARPTESDMLSSISDFSKVHKKRKIYEQPQKPPTPEKEKPKSIFESFVNSQFTPLETQIEALTFADETRIATEKGLPQELGEIFKHTAKEVIAITRNPADPSGLLYLCRWEQDFLQTYLLPSWV